MKHTAVLMFTLHHFFISVNGFAGYDFFIEAKTVLGSKKPPQIALREA